MVCNIDSNSIQYSTITLLFSNNSDNIVNSFSTFTEHCYMVYVNTKLYLLRLRFNQVITITWRDNLAILLHFLFLDVIALHCKQNIFWAVPYI